MSNILINLLPVARIIKFIDLGFRIANYGRKLCSSVDGALLGDLQVWQHELSTSQESLEEIDVQHTAETGEDEDGEDIVTALYTNCRAVAADLMIRLLILNMNKTTFRVSENSQWPKENLDALVRQLHGFMIEVELLIIPRLRENIDIQGFYLSQGFVNLDRETQSFVENLAHGRPLFSSENIAKPVFELDIAHERPEGISLDETPNAKTLELQALSDKGAVLQEFILEHLKFASMKDREEEVAPAHRKTFDWVFEHDIAPASRAAFKSKPGLFSWLHDVDSEIFWVNGKAGSGKSTLMRYIFNHKKTIDAFKGWAGSQPLNIAKFFFWTSGTLEQRSQSGMLRHILYQLLDQRKELIPLVLPTFWERCWSSTTQERIRMTVLWPIQDLITGLKLFLTHSAGKNKCAIIIDGLDEFGGNHDEMIALLKDIVGSAQKSLKICVSSRPWPVFERAFVDIPSLRLQDLTSNDMFQYVQDDFKQYSHNEQTDDEEPPHLPEIVRETVRKADGVFLWVVLACKHFHRRLGNEGTLDQIMELLSELPTDLDDFFRLLLFRSRSEDQLKQACRTFQLLRAREIVCNDTGDQSTLSVTLWELTLALQCDGHEAIEAVIQRPHDEEVLRRCLETKSQLSEICAGLLEIHRKRIDPQSLGPRFVGENPFGATQMVAHGKVTYLHRTVKDFLATPKEWRFILQQTVSTLFDSHQCHLTACLLQLKWPLEEPERHRRLDERWSSIVLLMTHARYATENVNELVDALDNTMNALWVTRRPDGQDTWARNCFGSLEARHNKSVADPFVSLATRFGLTIYVSIQLAKSLNQQKHRVGQPVLFHAIEYLVSRQKSLYPLSQPMLVDQILHYDVDPNQVFSTVEQKDDTSWLWALRSVRQANRLGWIRHYDLDERGTKRWVDVLKMLLRCGADANAFLKSTRKDLPLTALELVDLLLETYNSREIWELRELLVERGARVGDKGSEIDAAQKASAAGGVPAVDEEELEDVSKPRLRSGRPSRVRNMFRSAMQDDDAAVPIPVPR